MVFKLLCVYIILCTLLYRSNKNLRAHYVMAVFIPLSILLAYRSPNMPICVDTYAYIEIFNLSTYQSWSDILTFESYKGSEFGYWAVNKAFSLLSTEYLYFQIAISILTCGSIGYFIYKHVENPILGIAIYLGLGFYFTSYNITRQMLVVSIFALCLPLYTSRKNIPISLALTFLLWTLHSTALMYILCSLLLVIPRKFEKLLPVLLLLLVVFFNSVMQYSIVFFGKYESYYENAGEHAFGLGMSVIVYLIFWIISFVAFYSKKIEEQQLKLYSILSLFSITCIFLGLRMNYMERIGILFFPFVILTAVKFGDFFDNNGNRNLYFALLTISMFIFFILRSPEYISYV